MYSDKAWGLVFSGQSEITAKQEDQHTSLHNESWVSPTSQNYSVKQTFSFVENSCTTSQYHSSFTGFLSQEFSNSLSMQPHWSRFCQWKKTLREDYKTLLQNALHCDNLKRGLFANPLCHIHNFQPLHILWLQVLTLHTQSDERTIVFQYRCMYPDQEMDQVCRITKWAVRPELVLATSFRKTETQNMLPLSWVFKSVPSSSYASSAINSFAAAGDLLPFFSTKGRLRTQKGEQNACNNQADVRLWLNGISLNFSSCWQVASC